MVDWNLSGDPDSTKTIRIYLLNARIRLAWMLLSQLHCRLEVPWCAIGRGTSFVNDRLYGYVRNSCTLCNAVAARIADSVLESKPQHRIFFCLQTIIDTS